MYHRPEITDEEANMFEKWRNWDEWLVRIVLYAFGILSAVGVAGVVIIAIQIVWSYFSKGF